MVITSQFGALSKDWPQARGSKGNLTPVDTLYIVPLFDYKIDSNPAALHLFFLVALHFFSGPKSVDFVLTSGWPVRFKWHRDEFHGIVHCANGLQHLRHEDHMAMIPVALWLVDMNLMCQNWTPPPTNGFPFGFPLHKTQ